MDCVTEYLLFTQPLYTVDYVENGTFRQTVGRSDLSPLVLIPTRPLNVFTFYKAHPLIPYGDERRVLLPHIVYNSLTLGTTRTVMTFLIITAFVIERHVE